VGQYVEAEFRHDWGSTASREVVLREAVLALHYSHTYYAPRLFGAVLGHDFGCFNYLDYAQIMPPIQEVVAEQGLC
jgi:hypothetical protein